MTKLHARLALGATSLVLLMLLVLPLVGCPANDEPETPEAAFLASLERIEARDFEGEWHSMTQGGQQTWGMQIDELKRIVRADPGNRPAFDKLLDAQYELNSDEFLKLDPRALHARFLEVNRSEILRYQIDGEAVIENDTARLPVRMLKGEEPADYIYLRVDGRWLLDQGKDNRDKR